MISDGSPVLLGDVNGDGKADLVGIGAPGMPNAGYVYVSLSNGTSFPGWIWNSGYRIISNGSRVLLGDVNKDNKTDLISVTPGGYINIYPSNGTGFNMIGTRPVTCIEAKNLSDDNMSISTYLNVYEYLACSNPYEQKYVCGAGGTPANGIESGYAKYSAVNFGPVNSQLKFTASTAGISGSSRIDIWIDGHVDGQGTKLGFIVPPPVGGDPDNSRLSFQTVSTINMGQVTGVHDVYLVISGGIAGYEAACFDWIKFE
jgi:hypothetical protein